jgi:hypothetical protein
VHQDAVFFEQRRQVGNRADGDKVEEVAHIRQVRPAGRAQTGAQRGGEIERHAHRGQTLKREGTARLMGVKQRQGLAGALRNLMVVDDDDFDAEIAAVADGVVVAGAAVASDDQRAAGRCQVVGIALAEAIAFAAVRDAR